MSTVSATVVTTDTTILISWTSSGPGVDKYVVKWERDTSGKCPDVESGNDTIPGGSTDYQIENILLNALKFLIIDTPKINFSTGRYFLLEHKSLLEG